MTNICHNWCGKSLPDILPSFKRNIIWTFFDIERSIYLYIPCLRYYRYLWLKVRSRKLLLNVKWRLLKIMQWSYALEISLNSMRGPEATLCKSIVFQSRTSGLLFFSLSVFKHCSLIYSNIGVSLFNNAINFTGIYYIEIYELWIITGVSRIQ